MSERLSKKPDLDLDPKRVGHFAPGEKIRSDDELAKRVETALGFLAALLHGCEVVLLVRKGGSGVCSGAETKDPESTVAMLSESLQALLEPDVFRSFMQALSEREQRRHAEERGK